MILVLDASALIALARIGRLDLLREIGSHVYIPQGVHDEVVGRVKAAPAVVKLRVRGGFRGRRFKTRLPRTV